MSGSFKVESFLLFLSIEEGNSCASPRSCEGCGANPACSRLASVAKIDDSVLPGPFETLFFVSWRFGVSNKGCVSPSGSSGVYDTAPVVPQSSISVGRNLNTSAGISGSTVFTFECKFDEGESVG
jgi:hypothetical protein